MNCHLHFGACKDCMYTENIMQYNLKSLYKMCDACMTLRCSGQFDLPSVRVNCPGARAYMFVAGCCITVNHTQGIRSVRIALQVYEAFVQGSSGCL